jgi:hypothetical protein
MNRIILFNADTSLSREWALFRRGNYTAIAVFIKDGTTWIVKGYDALTGTPLPSGIYPVGEANYYETSVNLAPLLKQEVRQIDYHALASFLIAGTSMVTGIDRLNHCFNDSTLGALHLTSHAGPACLPPPSITKLEFQNPSIPFDATELHRTSFRVLSSVPLKRPQSGSVESLRRSLERIPLPILRLYRIDRCYNQIAQETGNELLPMITSNNSEIISLIDQVHPELANALDQQLDLFQDRSY